MWTTETLVSYQKDNRKATQKVTSLRHVNTLLPSIFLSTMLTFRSFLKKYLLTIIYFIPRPYSSDSPKDASQVFWHWTFFFWGLWGWCQGIKGFKQAPEQSTVSCMSGLQHCVAGKKTFMTQKCHNNLQPCVSHVPGCGLVTRHQCIAWWRKNAYFFFVSFGGESKRLGECIFSAVLLAKWKYTGIYYSFNAIFITLRP